MEPRIKLALVRPGHYASKDRSVRAIRLGGAGRPWDVTKQTIFGEISRRVETLAEARRFANS